MAKRVQCNAAVTQGDVYNFFFQQPGATHGVNHNELSALAQRTRSHNWSLYQFPAVELSATTWPSTSSDIDHRWDKVVQDT